MDLDWWRPVYEAIGADFGYDPAEDERVAHRLEAVVRPGVWSRLSFDGASVAVVVGAALDRDGFEQARRVDRVVATGDALEPLDRAGIAVSLAVTDLDSDPARVCRRSRAGGIVAVHAHGDNEPAIDRWAPRMHRANLVGTTQAPPVGSLVNVGGFTDGDRAAYLADALGAASLSLVGWDLADTEVTATKRRKLRWAARLLTHLETVRGERYDALDGVREPLELASER